MSTIKVSNIQDIANNAAMSMSNGVVTFVKPPVGAGKVLQVITATDSTARTSSSTSFVTGSNTLAVAITPSATSSKIFVTASLGYRTPTGTVSLYITLYRGSTNLGPATGFSNTFSGSSYYYGQATPQILDSPSSTSELTYQVYFRIGSGSNVGGINTGISTITAFEIAG